MDFEESTMARANRHYLPGHVWHITHRCHQKEFLLKLSQDRKRYTKWLYEAKKRYGLSILNFAITSNHIHLMVFDTGKDVIPRSIQLVAGRTGQEYNNRKDRKGAFWEDRYHATIVQSNRHLLSCMAYIDLNMVRAGVVLHPSEWQDCGYNEIIHQPERAGLIDVKKLKSVLGFSDADDLAAAYQQIILDAIQDSPSSRQPMWTEGIVVGDEDYVKETKSKLTGMALGREIIAADSAFVLREPSFPYGFHFDARNSDLELKNTYYWDI
jgi:putative transposase